MNTKTLYKMALSKWGNTAQINMTIEECSELIKELAKIDRVKNGSTVDNIIEEMVDVEIMLGQMKVMLNNYPVTFNFKFGSACNTFDIIKRQKLKKLERLLNE